MCNSTTFFLPKSLPVEARCVQKHLLLALWVPARCPAMISPNRMKWTFLAGSTFPGTKSWRSKSETRISTHANKREISAVNWSDSDGGSRLVRSGSSIRSAFSLRNFYLIESRINRVSILVCYKSEIISILKYFSLFRKLLNN